jgi:hypothetical protein
MSLDTRFANLEIGLHRHDPENCSVEMRATPADNDAETRLVRGAPAATQFDFVALRELALGSAAYGRALSCVSGDATGSQVHAAFDQTRVVAHSQGAPLRLRLFLGPSTPEL